MHLQHKPITAEAYQLPIDGQCANAPAWFQAAQADGRLRIESWPGEEPDSAPEYNWEIDTPEGLMVALAGDWVVSDSLGELYYINQRIYDLYWTPASADESGAS